MNKDRADAAFKRLKKLYEMSAPKPMIEMMLIGFVNAYFGSSWKFFKAAMRLRFVDLKIRLIDKLPFALMPRKYKEVLRQINKDDK